MTPEQAEQQQARRIEEAAVALWAGIRERAILEALQRLIAGGNTYEALDMLGDIVADTQAALGPALEKAIIAGGDTIAAVLPANAITGATGVSIADATTSAYVRNYVGTKVVEIGRETQEAIRAIIEEGILTGTNPRQVAREVRQSVGLNTRQQQAVRNFRRYLETDPQKALGYELRDARFDRTLAKGEPLTKDQIDKMVSRYIDGQLKYRAEMIAQTEAMTAVTIGQQEAIRQGVESGAIQERLDDGRTLRQFWIATHDGRTRHVHLQIPGMNKDGVEVGKSFQTPLGPLRFPRDPNGTAANVIKCRCRTRWKWA